MKRIITFMCIVVIVNFCYSQSKLFFQSKNNKNIEFTVSQEDVYIEFSETPHMFSRSSKQQEFIMLNTQSGILKNSYSTRSFYETQQELDTTKTISKIEPVLVYKDGTKQIAKGELIVKVKPNCSLQEIFEGVNFSFSTNRYDKNLFLVKTDLSTVDLFKFVSRLQPNTKIDFIEPNFIRLIKPYSSDTYFQNQWGVKNTGQYGGTIGIDINADLAWKYATGAGVKVAVIDEGVDLSHPDLAPNLLVGYDATGLNSAGAPKNDDPHGTACAGIIAAKANNNIGIAGVAYNSNIIPIRIAYRASNGEWVFEDYKTADGIKTAVEMGADILSNSWGGGSISVSIDSEISNALNIGRNGLGCLVVFASANKNSSIYYPANSNPDILVVGATSMCGERKNPNSCDKETWWGSNYGNELDVVAPGVEIYTTDISGEKGYSSDDYYPHFNGTSSACPHVAGIAALILSVNPHLKGKQVQDIIEKTAQKVGDYSYTNHSERPNGEWDDEMGYGLVDAYAAVKMATEMLPPTNLTATNIRYRDFTLNWTGVDNTVGYKVYDVTNAEEKLVGTTTETKLAIKDLEMGETYKYAVKAKFTNATSEYSDTLSVTTLEAKLLGAKTICDQETYTIENFLPNTEIKWSTNNSNLELVSVTENGKKATFAKKGNGICKVVAELKGVSKALKKEVMVGVPLASEIGVYINGETVGRLPYIILADFDFPKLVPYPGLVTLCMTKNNLLYAEYPKKTTYNSYSVFDNILREIFHPLDLKYEWRVKEGGQDWSLNSYCIRDIIDGLPEKSLAVVNYIEKDVGSLRYPTPEVPIFEVRLCSECGCSEWKELSNFEIKYCDIRDRIFLLTPNGDGVNDTFEITETAKPTTYSTSTTDRVYNLTIFDNEGNVVYEKDNYMQDAERFVGIGNTGNYANATLSGGNYYYTLTGSSNRSGTIYLERE